MPVELFYIKKVVSLPRVSFGLKKTVLNFWTAPCIKTLRKKEPRLNSVARDSVMKLEMAEKRTQ
jgi:hypothetical protein